MRSQIYKLFIDLFFLKDRVPLKNILTGLEKRIIIRVLDRTGGNQKEAAGLLGIKYTTLNEKIKKYGITL